MKLYYVRILICTLFFIICGYGYAWNGHLWLPKPFNLYDSTTLPSHVRYSGILTSYQTKSLLYSSKHKHRILYSKLVDEEPEDEEDSESPLIQKIKRCYESLFFYGINTPKRRNQNIDFKIPKKRGFDSLFFTPSELIGLRAVAEPGPSRSSRDSSVFSNSDESVQLRLEKVSSLIDSLQGDLEIVEATIATLPDDESKRSLIAEQERIREDLLQKIASLKIEYVNIIAEMND